MKTHFRLLAALIFAALLMLPTSEPAIAATFQLTGRVTDGSGTPISGATVEVLNPGTTTVVASTATDGSGNYVLSVEGGTYDVRVTPPPGSGFQALTIQDWTVATNQTLDIVLVPVGPEMVGVTGQIMDREGTPLTNRNVTFQTIAAVGVPASSATTDGNGRYSTQVRAGVEYQIVIHQPTSPVLPRPQHVGTLPSHPLVFSQSTTTFDIQIPSSRVDIHVQDPVGNPVAGVNVNTNQVTGDFDLTTSLGPIRAYGQSTDDGITDASGNATLWLFSSSDPYTIFAYPPVDSPYLQTSVPNVVITGDRSLLIAFQFSHAAPQTTATLAPSPNAQGKYPDPVTVTLSANAFPGFTVAASYYSVDGSATKTYASPFLVSGDGSHSIRYWSVDTLGVIESPNTLTFQIQSNQPPSANAGGPYFGKEGAAIPLHGTASDPENSSLTINWSYMPVMGVDAGAACTFTNGNTLTPSITCTDDGSYKVTLTVSDGTNAPVSSDASLTIDNVEPVFPISTPGADAPYALGSATNLSASFTDAGTNDTHTCQIDWDDGTGSQSGTISEANGAGTCAGSHTFTAPGVYIVKITVTDDDGSSSQPLYLFVVIYDPNGGFVTGGGWINSPAGAYAPDPSLTGKANFGFVSKYQKGATVPTGETEFQFKVANLNFHSTSYQWLVVAGAKAQYKGSGTINGSGDYGFMLTAIDGQVNGGGGVDKFRIKIWDTGGVIYDNQMGAGDDAAPTTAIGGGSIVIHK